MTIEERNEAHDKDENKKPEGLAEIFSRFMEGSTFPAVGYMQKKVNIFRRVFWLLIVICGVSVCVYQSAEVVSSYLKYPTFLTETEKVNSTVFFPAVTICPKNLVDWEKVKRENHSLFHIIEKEANSFPGEEKIDKRRRLEKLLIKELYLMKRNERDKVLYKHNTWLRRCFIMSISGESDECFNSSRFTLPTIYSPYYGECITINPGFNENTSLREDNKSIMEIKIELPANEQFPYMGRSDGIIITIHPPGSAPVIHWHSQRHVLPGQFMFAAMKVYDLQSLTYPYSSNCSGDDSGLAKWTRNASPYYSEATPYAYSYEECMATCYFKEILKRKECVIAFMAIDEAIENQRRNMCRAEDINHELLDEIEKVCAALCNKRCRALIYSWIPSTMNLADDEGFLHDVMEEVSGENTIDMTKMILIVLKMESTVYVIGEETPKYELKDVFGAIGGNLGLWIGISSLTLFEIFELITSLILYFLRKFFSCFSKKK